MSVEFREEILRFVSLGDLELRKLEEHFELMLAWNSKLNLTRITKTREAARRHYVESLLACDLLGEATRIVDVGSGAGFPGVPMGIRRPSLQVFLLESDIRKSVFLKETTRGAENFRVVNKRSEKFEATVDAVVSRAVRWQDLSRLAHRLKTDVIWITSDDELLSSTWNITSKLTLPDGAGVIARLCHETGHRTVPRGTLVR